MQTPRVRQRTQYDDAQNFTRAVPIVCFMDPSLTHARSHLISADFHDLPVAAPRKKSGVRDNLISMSSSLLLLIDLACLLLAALLSTVFHERWIDLSGALPRIGHSLGPAALVMGALAPIVLYDPHFGANAHRGLISPLVRAHALRLVLLTGLVLALGMLGGAMTGFTREWLVLWFSIALLTTLLVRLWGGRFLRRLHNQGGLNEIVAIVGAGQVADRLARTLRRARPDTIELLGIFDDNLAGAEPNSGKATGTIAQLLEVGKLSRVDWILLALPATAEHRIPALLQRLKALSAPIGLCPPHVALDLPYRSINYVADGVPVSLLADHPVRRWDVLADIGADFLPRWMITLALLPVQTIEFLAIRLIARQRTVKQASTAPLTFQFDDYDVEGFSSVAARFGQERFGYVVTPNADHMIRLHESAAFRDLYAAASFILLDSRFLSHIMRVTKSLKLPVCTGSDLTERLLAAETSPNDALVLVGGSTAQAGRLRERYGLKHLAHFNPPMGFIRDPVAVQACLEFIEAHSPFRFCLLAVGAPQQESMAKQLQERGRARGLALCIGASINFLTGDERRAPVWLQRCGMEWSYRLLQAPGRMGKRYLVRGPRIFGLLHGARVVLRQADASARQPARAAMEDNSLTASTWDARGPDRRSGIDHRSSPCRTVSAPDHSNELSRPAGHVALPPEHAPAAG